VTYLRRLDRIAVDHDFTEPHDRIARALRVLRTDDAGERKRLQADFLNWIDEPLELPKAHSALAYRAAQR
jgi:hypothetical protein